MVCGFADLFFTSWLSKYLGADLKEAKVEDGGLSSIYQWMTG